VQIVNARSTGTPSLGLRLAKLWQDLSTARASPPVQRDAVSEHRSDPTMMPLDIDLDALAAVPADQSACHQGRNAEDQGWLTMPYVRIGLH